MKIVSKHPLLVGTALLTIMSAGIYGCSDFLANNASPQGTVDSNTLSNAAGVEGTLVGAYRALDCTSALSPNWGCAASYWVFGGVAGDDAYKGSNATDQPPINDIEGRHWGTADAESYLNTKWRISYEGVVRANAAINLFKSVYAANPTAFSVATAHAIEGEALFLRAHYHFEAWRMWGNIPYYRETETDFRKPGETGAAVATDIIKDLDSAIKLLPLVPRNKGRAGQWTAKAYKGRVQVYAASTTPALWAAAVTTLTDVVNNGPYKLETSFDRVWTGFADEANGLETIWAFQASANDGEPNGINANFGERLNFPYSGSHFGCCGFNQPSQSLVNFFKVDPTTGLPMAMTNPTTWNASDVEFKSTDVTTPVDPRLDWTVGRDGVPFKDWGPVNVGTGGSASWVRDIGNGGPYVPKKNAHEKASGAESTTGWQPTQLNSVNIHLYRYADVLLMLAEAMVETGNLTGAQTIVNQIRTRAAAAAQGPGTTRANIAVALSDTSIHWAKYQVGQYLVPWTDPVYAREAVRSERRLELAMEGQRFFDLRRYGLAYAKSVLDAYIASEGTAARRLYKAQAEPFIARHMLYAIPGIQIELSKTGGQQTLTQNPGW